MMIGQALRVCSNAHEYWLATNLQLIKTNILFVVYVRDSKILMDNIKMLKAGPKNIERVRM